MAEKQGDLLMKFVQTNGEGVKAEGAATLKKDDRLLFDFWPGKFFEIEEFSFGLNVEDSEAGGKTLSMPGTPRPPGAPAPVEHATPAVKFAAWRDAKKNSSQVDQITYPVVMDPFSFTRLVDKASPVFFHNCTNSISFASATLVKRKFTGGTLALQAFLRVDFSDVLITSLDWDDGHIIKEKCKFICRGVAVQYKRQASDGSLAAPSSAEWTRDLALRGSTG